MTTVVMVFVGPLLGSRDTIEARVATMLLAGPVAAVVVALAARRWLRPCPRWAPGLAVVLILGGLYSVIAFGS